jgi:hypothetical protein
VEQVSTIMALFASFRPELTMPTFENLGLLLRGALLAPGERTVTACVRSASPWMKKHVSAYENVLSRAKFDGKALARELFKLIEGLIPEGAPINLIVDDSLVRRFGPYVACLGIHRDALRNSRGQGRILSLGHKWITLSVGVKLPFVAGWIALPVLSALYVPKEPPRRSKAWVGGKHRTPARIAKLLTAIVAGWAPERRFRLTGDKAYASHDLADAMNDKGANPRLRHVALVSRLQDNAGLYAPAPDYSGRGRRRVKGEKIASPGETASEPDARWETVEVAWYGGGRKSVNLLSGTGLWYRCGTKATGIKWVMMKDPEGRRDDEIIFTTETGMLPSEIIETFVCRWSLEVTFEEVRRHLGLETLRNRTYSAVSRSVPLLLGLFSFIVVWFALTGQHAKVRPNSAPWYKKTVVTFSDMFDSAREDILKDLFSIRGGPKPSVFFLAPFPLNALYAYLAEKDAAA